MNTIVFNQDRTRMPSFNELKTKSTVLVTCPKGLSGYLKHELESHTLPIIGEYSSGVSVRASFNDCMRLNLTLSHAHHVLFMLKESRCATPDEMYHAVISIDWENIIPNNGYVCVTSVVHTPSINDSRYANLKCKDAIVDKLVKKTGRRCDSGSERSKTVVFLYWVDDRCCIYLDTSGEPLSKRGYRAIPGSAPMQETLASAVVATALTNNPPVIINPMCGSGTLAIEAALKICNKAPGLTRTNFGFMHCMAYDVEEYMKIRRTLEAAVKRKPEIRIIATDINPDVIAAARHNAKAAEMDGVIEFGICDFRETPIPESNGVILLNPEYGYRLGEVEKLQSVYRSIGDFFKQDCKGYTGYVFTGNFDLAKFIGLKARRKYPFLSGKIECRLYEYELYAGSKATAVKE